jgi:hypothetical protein
MATPSSGIAEHIRRQAIWNGSNRRSVKEECEALGVGYTHSDTNGGVCFYPCPDAYEVNPQNTGECETRPLLTAITTYYSVLAEAGRSCLDKSSAYKQAVIEAGGDPASLPFPAECPNPYSCTEGAYANTSDLPPMPFNTDTTVPSNSDPNGTSGIAGAGGNTDLSKYSQLSCKNGQWEPFIPPPPYDPQIDTSGGVGEPSSRLTLTVEEIDRIPLESEYGSAGRRNDLSQELYNHPTLLDVDPRRIKDYVYYVPDFAWSCVITQSNFDKMPDSVKCGLIKHYFDYTTNADRVAQLRGYDPTILITRDAPPTVAPTFSGDPETAMRQQCEGQSNDGRGGCKWTGDCEGSCACPPKPPPPTKPPAPAPPEMPSFIVVGGVALVGMVGLYVAYNVYKVATPTGRAMSAISS